MLTLARHWLVLPEGNPALPAGDPRSVKVWNPGEGYLGYRMLGFWLSSLGALGGVLGSAAGGLALLATQPRDLPGPVATLMGVGLLLLSLGLLLGVLFGWAVVHLELDMLRYTFTDRAMRLRRGVLKLEEVTLSYANVQNVQLVQGPVQRWFGIGDLLVDTAGGGAQAANPQQVALGHRGLIKGVGDPERLRDFIIERVRAFRGAGLGDAEAHRKPTRAAAGGLASPQACALLREIRAGLAAIRPAARP